MLVVLGIPYTGLSDVRFSNLDREPRCHNVVLVHELAICHIMSTRREHMSNRHDRSRKDGMIGRGPNVVSMSRRRLTADRFNSGNQHSDTRFVFEPELDPVSCRMSTATAPPSRRPRPSELWQLAQVTVLAGNSCPSPMRMSIGWFEWLDEEL